MYVVVKQHNSGRWRVRQVSLWSSYSFQRQSNLFCVRILQLFYHFIFCKFSVSNKSALISKKYLSLTTKHQVKLILKSSLILKLCIARWQNVKSYFFFFLSSYDQSSHFLMKLLSSRNGENEESLFLFLGEWGNEE